MVEHRSVINILSALAAAYPLRETDRCLLKTSFTFDVSVSELFGWYWSGGQLVVPGKDDHKDPGKILDIIEHSQITHINFVPSAFKVFIDQLDHKNCGKLTGLKYIFLAGEALSPRQVEKFNELNTGIILRNLYGPTECTIYVSAFSLNPWSGSGTIPIGKPLPNTKLYILNNNLCLLPVGVGGELCIAGVGVSRGYLDNPEITFERFINAESHILSSFPSSANSPLYHPPLATRRWAIYKTGDLARWLPQGNIQFLGRLDQQVKIRGFRIEPGEIENQLLAYEGVKDSVVVARTGEKEDLRLCAYIVADIDITVEKLRDFLSGRLPDYMVPSYFMPVKKIPLTPGGKIDRNALPEHAIAIASSYPDPRNGLERKLVRIWSDLLGLEKRKISIDANFFALGGHSLTTVVLAAKIHKEWKVKITLADLFNSPTIRNLSSRINESVKKAFIPIEPVEKKEYYVLASAQKRLYVLQQMELPGTAYNIPLALSLEGELDKSRLDGMLCELIRRHESLRTSFHMIDEEQVQRIHEKVEFKIEYYDTRMAGADESGERKTGPCKPIHASGGRDPGSREPGPTRCIDNCTRPFDLSHAPLLRVGLIKVEDRKHILIIDMHHIITDGTSLGSFVKESMELYAGQGLPPLKLQYKDYAQWQNSEPQKKARKDQEEYWLKQFAGEIPVLNLPLDYTRPAIQSFAGASLTFELPVPTTQALNRLALHTGATLYMVLLAIYNILLSKLSGQEDIVVGIPIAARRHADLAGIIGMFVNTLAMRSYPEGNKKFNDFLLELKENNLEAFENQEYPFEDLVETILVHRDVTRHPLFDTMFGLQNPGNPTDEIVALDISPLKIKPFTLETQISKLDLSLSCEEKEGIVVCTFEYCTEIFKEETLRRFVTYFKQLVSWISGISGPGSSDSSGASPGSSGARHEKISRIEILGEAEKNQVLKDFNDTVTPLPKDKTLCQLFEEQAVRNPNREAVTELRDLSPLYEELRTEKINPGLIGDLEKCCFKRNSYIFQYPGQHIIDALDIFAGQEKEGWIMLRTHRLNYAAVNARVFSLLDYFDGRANVKSILTGMGKTPDEFVIQEIRKDEYSDFAPGIIHRVIVGGSMEDLLYLIKVLFRCHLIDLVGWSSRPIPLIIRPERFEPPKPPGDQPSGTREKEKEFKGMVGNNTGIGLEKGIPGSEFSVLLLGDRTGSATTGILYITSFLRRNGITAYCQWNDMNSTTASLRKNIKGILETLQPPVKILGVSMKWFPHIARVLEICKTVKEFNPLLKVVVGGNTASYYPEEIIRCEWIDYVVRGDGEVPFLKICLGEEDIPNCLVKKAGKIVEAPMSYIQDEKNSKEIYLSHLEEIFVSKKDIYLAPYFYIYTGKGCSMHCFYCGGCREAQKKTFNRDKPFLRGIEEARRDILEIMKYTSTIWFDFDMPLSCTVEYYRQLWEGIDLSGHFCEFYSWKLPGKEFIDTAAGIFKYVYINIDLCSLSQGHRLKLSSLGLVKPQPTDEELFSFFDNCEVHRNVEVIINHITGLPYFSAEDIRIGKDVLANLVKTYSTLGGMAWGRLHAQPGAPLTKTYKNYDMKAYAETFEEFLSHSKRNLQETRYPVLETYYYPYIYFNDDHLNSLVTRYYLEMDEKIEGYQKMRRKLRMVNIGIAYRQLHEQADRLTRELKIRGVKPGTIVGLMVNRTGEMVIGMLAILGAGGTYMPIDPAYPEERLRYMLKDSNTNILLTGGNLCHRFENPGAAFSCDMIAIAAENNYLANRVKPGSGPEPGSAAYVMYTSGSTGRPKGVMISQRNVIRLVKNNVCTDFPPGSRLLMTGSIAFDIITFELWAPLLNGWHLYLAGGSTGSIVTDAEKLNRVLKSNRVSILHLVPQLFNRLAAETLDIFARLRYFLVGGDLVKPWYINRLRDKYPGLKILHMYGPTEGTTFSTFLPVEIAYEDRIPLGKPVSNSTVYIMGKGKDLLPIGAVGELVIGGEGIARGYLNNPELTAEKFIITPEFHESTGIVKQTLLWGSRGRFSRKEPPGRRRQKLYRTGDLARWLPDGNIEFSGRLDSQVKLRGIRIELGEIESRLLAHPGIREAVVQVLPGTAGSEDTYLCAYIAADKEIPASEMREFLAKSLPGPMIPSYFVFLERIPLTASGKVDRRALPLPGVKTGAVYTAPRNETEKKLAAIWLEVLARDAQQVSQLETTLGIDDNFFELGGHSLKAAGMISRVNSEFKVEVPLVELFKTPSIRELAEYIRQAGNKSFPVPVKDSKDNNLVLLRENPGAAGNLFFLHDGTGEVESYIELCAHLEAGYNYWGIRARRLDNYTPRNLSIGDIAAGYIEEIKTRQPGGPYRLAGWSLGGVTAFEMALQLEQRGEAISFLGLIDAPAPPGKNKKAREEFSRESEIHWVNEFLPGEKIKEKLGQASQTHEIWPVIINHLEENTLAVEIIKGLKPGFMAHIIPHYDRLTIRESIYYLNIHRTLTRAQAFYIPATKIRTPLNYFKASESLPVIRDRWQAYCINPIKSFEIPGDHFSILKTPNFYPMAKIFERLLNNIV